MKILLMEENEIVNDDGKIATIMNRYFTNITKHMNLKANKINYREELQPWTNYLREALVFM